jgi:hypothetical protein
MQFKKTKRKFMNSLSACGRVSERGREATVFAKDNGSGNIPARKNMWKYNGSQRPPFAETPAPGQESVWDYPRPPKLVADSRLLIVRLG